MPLSKKIFVISFSLFVVLLLLWGVYYFSFREAISTKEEPLSKNTIKNLLVSEEKVMAISEDAVLGPILIKEESAIKYYSKENGIVYKIEFDGSRKTPFSEKELLGLTKALWSPNQNGAITKRNNSFFYYDYLNRENYALKSNLDNVVWQNNEKIIYKYYNPSTGKRSLNIANPDGSAWTELTNLEFKNLGVAPVPMSGLISFWNQGNGFEETSLQTIPALGGEIKTIFSGKFGADYLWSPDGNQLLISHVDQKSSSKIQLAVANSKGGEYKNLGIPTLVSKCVWSKNENVVYYAMPGTIPDNAVMPNDYLDKKFTTTDTFWKINLDTGKKDRLIELDDLQKAPPIDASNLFLSEDESLLFLINQNDGKLYRLTL